MPGRLVVVGLGPGGVDLMVPAARHALESADLRVARTERHRAVTELRAAGLEIASFDDLYEKAHDLDDVYPAIVVELVAMAGRADVVAYAVPGNPAVAERSVMLLREEAADRGIDVDVVPGLSFAELACARLGVDPMSSGVRVVDGHDPVAAAALTGPVLIAQCDHPLVLADLKLALLEHVAPETPVTVLTRLGLADEQIEHVTVVELDRIAPDHLTALFLDAEDAGAAREFARLLELSERLRAPGGCPWDAEQTHHSLTRYLLEEAYEVVEAVEALPVDAPTGDVDPNAYAALADELGDLLYQVVFHAVLADEAGGFDMADVARGVHDKLVRRHPHVFGSIEASSSAEVMRNWEQIKKQEKGVDSIVAGVTPGLPALLYAHKLYRKAASIGIESGDPDVAIARIRATTDALEGAPFESIELLVGELLADAVVLARASGIDAESALTAWALRFRRRFEALEALARARGLDLATLDAAHAQAIWDEVGESSTGSDAG